MTDNSQINEINEIYVLVTDKKTNISTVSTVYFNIIDTDELKVEMVLKNLSEYEGQSEKGYTDYPFKHEETKLNELYELLKDFDIQGELELQMPDNFTVNEIDSEDNVLVDTEYKKLFTEILDYLTSDFSTSQEANFYQNRKIFFVKNLDDAEIHDSTVITDISLIEMFFEQVFETTYNVTISKIVDHRNRSNKVAVTRVTDSGRYIYTKEYFIFIQE